MLIAAWHEALQHPAITVRFADPVAFAVAQLAVHVASPTLAELAHWASWHLQGSRNGPPQLIAPNESPPAADEAIWAAAYARVLLPGANTEDLALLTSLLVQGATEDEALALL